jgi:uncharacterized protein YacL
MPPKIKRMNKGAYLTYFSIMLILNLAAIVVASIIMNREREMVYLLPAMVAWCVLIMIASVGLAVFHYRMWAAIYEKDMEVGGVKIDPVIAVVLLFISFVGEYWTFRFYTEFVSHYNDTVEKYGDELQLLSITGAFTSLPVLRLIVFILGFFCVIPYTIIVALPLAWFLTLVMYFIFLKFTWQISDAVNSLADAVENQTTSADVP